MKHRSVALIATSSAVRNATMLWKFKGGGSGRGGGATGSTTSGACTSGTTISRVGLPHLWQKSESGTSCVPQVQNSGMGCVLAHLQFDAHEPPKQPPQLF